MNMATGENLVPHLDIWNRKIQVTRSHKSWLCQIPTTNANWASSLYLHCSCIKMNEPFIGYLKKKKANSRLLCKNAKEKLSCLCNTVNDGLYMSSPLCLYPLTTVFTH